MSDKITIPAILESYTPRTDGSFGLRFSTNVLTPEEKVLIDCLYQKFGALLFKDGEITKQEVEMIDKVETDLGSSKMTPSQRLRFKLLKLWEQDKTGFKTSEEHYKHHIEKYIKHVDSKII